MGASPQCGPKGAVSEPDERGRFGDFGGRYVAEGLVAALEGGSMVHCTLPPGGVSLAVAHRTVEEIWYLLEGEGELWRKRGAREETAALVPGVGLTIPLGTHFQFRNTGRGPLQFIIATLPPWPGDEEAYRVADHWPVSQG